MPHYLARRNPLIARSLQFLAVALAGIVYYPITGTYFRTDDFLNLHRIVNWPMARYLVTPPGGGMSQRLLN